MCKGLLVEQWDVGGRMEERVCVISEPSHCGCPEDTDLMDQKVLQLEQIHAEKDTELEEKWVGLEEH